MPVTPEGKKRTGPPLKYGCQLRNIAITMPDRLVDDLDEFMKEEGEGVRSAVISHAVRTYISAKRAKRAQAGTSAS